MQDHKFIPVTTIAKYTVCPSQVYSELVLCKKIYEFTDAMNLGQYHYNGNCIHCHNLSCEVSI